ncbi:MAG: glycosyltransferase [Clostridia bacterium]|nr:glycosyltransferase [Clostridia bacterium]
MKYSVIIPSKNRADLMNILLESLSAAREKINEDTEVIIVDDSDEKNKEQILQSAETYGAKYIYKACSVSQKRNFGASVATNEVLLFLDSDVRVSPDLFVAYNEIFEAKKAKAVVGALKFEGDKYWYWDVVNASPFVKCFYMPNAMKELPWGCSCNIAINKELFDKIGGFSEDFKYPAGEDVDLGLRISTGLHIKIYSAPKALVYHSNETWRHWKEMHRRVKMYGKADVLLVEKHPECLTSTGIFRRNIMYFSILLISIIFALCTFNWWLLLIPAGYYLLENIGVALIGKFEYRRFGKISLLKQLAVQNLIHTNERAYLLTCLRRGKIGYMGKQLIYSYGQACSFLKFSSNTIVFQWILYLVSLLTILIIVK